MAAPLSGIGQQQVSPNLNQPVQPSENEETREVRQQEQDPREFELQAAGEPIAQSQDSSNQNSLSQRGTVVDLVV